MCPTSRGHPKRHFPHPACCHKPLDSRRDPTVADTPCLISRQSSRKSTVPDLWSASTTRLPRAARESGSSTSPIPMRSPRTRSRRSWRPPTRPWQRIPDTSSSMPRPGTAPITSLRPVRPPRTAAPVRAGASMIGGMSCVATTTTAGISRSTPFCPDSLSIRSAQWLTLRHRRLLPPRSTAPPWC